MPARPIGIDLGTTNSVIATIGASGRPEVVRNAEGKAVTPSVVYLGSGLPLVGDEAKTMQGVGEENVFSFFKRNMGDRDFLVSANGKDLSAIDLSALVLRKLKKDAETALSTMIETAVITVPAYFNDFQRKATMEAGRLAGLEVLKIINEPTAAAQAYRFDPSAPPETVLVYDLGGGTFDVSLVRRSKDELEVKATAGDHNLGGKDWDDRIIRSLAGKFMDQFGSDPLENSDLQNELLIRAEEVKKTLSVRDFARMTIQHGELRETFEITRGEFERLTADLMERTQLLCEEVLGNVGMSWDQLTGVLLVGGSTRMPMVHEYVRRMSGKPPALGVNVDEVVALGAAIEAAKILSEREPTRSAAGISGAVRTKDVMSHSMGMIAVSPDQSRYINSIIIPKNRPYPCEVSRPYQLRTRRNGENALDVYMTQGEVEDPQACSLIGKYRFTAIEHVEGSEAVLDITYSYDDNGVVQVKATQRSTGRALEKTVDPAPDDTSWLRKSPRETAGQTFMTAYLAFDLSGSMTGQPLVEAKAAAHEFVTQSDLAGAAIGLISFADRVLTNLSATQDSQSLNAAIDGMVIGPVGFGNAATPFDFAHKLLSESDGPRYIVVLTDGVWGCRQQAIGEARACHADGIEVIAIGFGSADRSFLASIATSEDRSFFARTGGELVARFGTIAKELQEASGGLAMSTSRGLKGK